MVQWNLSDIYPSAKEETLIEEYKKKVQDFKKYRSELNPKLTPARFMEIFLAAEEIYDISARLGAYAELRFSENTTDSKRIAHESKINELVTDAGNDMLFFMVWFKELSDEQAKPFVLNAGKHRFSLERARIARKYTLSEKEEKIIMLKDLTGESALSSLYDQIHNKFLFEWKPGKKITQEELMRYVRSPKAAERKKAYTLVLSRYKEEQVLGELYKYLATSWRNEYLKLRNYPNVVSPRNLSNLIPDSTIDVMMGVVRKNVTLFQDYFRLKAKLLGMRKLNRFDLYTPYSTKERSYSYDAARDMVLENFGSFSPDMKKMAESIFKANHVHSEILPGKRSGAFCYSILPNIMPYIMVNHADRLEDVFTLMHEVGHGIHSIAAREQTSYTFHAPLPLAETASVFSEMILTQNLLKNLPSEEKIHILLRTIDGQYATIMRQIYFVIFEKEAYTLIEKGATVDELDQRYYQLLKEMFGNSMDIPDLFMHEWKYIPHIYHTPFYCYAYAFGNLLVLALYQKYLEEGKSFIPKYLKLLSHGGGKMPKDILLELGIDMDDPAFWQSGFELIKQEVAQLKALVSK